MRRINLCLISVALLSLAPAAHAQSQSQSQSQTSGSQYSTQNNGSTYQSSYQVNRQNGAGQGQGSGTNQAQADYNASAGIRNSPASPQGSYQEQRQSIQGNTGTQYQRTTPPRSSRGGASPQ